MTEPTDIAGLMALVDQLVEHAREDDRMCYDQVSSQRFQDARDELQAVFAKWGTPQPTQAREIEGLREDAERYRWLREKPGTDLRYGSEQYTRVCAVCQNYGEDLDAAIDAARGAPHG